MDTRFWGPDGWLILHSITANYPKKISSKYKHIYLHFFNTLEFLLPCVYCRRSFSQYVKDIPIENYLDSKKNICLWLYLIHNKVNDKLKSQNLNHKDNPLFKTIYDRYNRYINDTKNARQIPGFKFLNSILFNIASNINVINKSTIYNLIKFIYLLPLVNPFTKFNDVYTEYLKRHPIENYISTSKELKKWMYNLSLTYSLKHDIKILSYSKSCNYLEDYKSNCVKKTCRLID
tara:strand:+ start:165 stop:863 length:699 start_codon:yes stop_codon:yes gene_type:complete